MKFSINAKELKDALALTNASVDKRRDQATSVLYLHAHKKTGNLLLFSTDGICRTMLKLEAEITQAGETCVDHALFQRLISTIPPQQTITCDLRGESARRFHVSSGPIRGKLPEPTANMELIRSWLQMMPIDDQNQVVMSVPAEAVCTLVHKIGPFVMHDGDEDKFKKLRIKASGKRLIAESTNRSVLAFASEPIETSFDTPAEVTFPSRGLDPLERALRWANSDQADIISYVPNGQTEPTAIYIRTDNLCFGISTNGLTPPNIEPLMTQFKPTLEIEVDKQSFSEAINRSAGFGQGNAKYIQIAMGGHGALVTKGEIVALDSAFEQELEGTVITPDPNDEATEKILLQCYVSGSFMSVIAAAPDSNKIRIAIEQNNKNQKLMISNAPTPKEHPDAPEPEEEKIRYILRTTESLPMELTRSSSFGGSVAAS